MIFGIGIDLVSIKRIKNLLGKFDDKFINKFFTKSEIKQSKKINKSLLPSFFAKRFAAKEAFSKAIGLGIGRGIDFKDIEVSNDGFGKPEITIINNKISFLHKITKSKKINIHLSLSDEKEMASAYVIIEK